MPQCPNAPTPNPNTNTNPNPDQVASFLSLARALFGDFDIDDIMNNSSGYTNVTLALTLTLTQTLALTP